MRPFSCRISAFGPKFNFGGEKIRCPQDVLIAADGVFPRGRLLAIRSGRETPSLENITDRMIADVIAQISAIMKQS
jgi:hypothetical protein